MSQLLAAIGGASGVTLGAFGAHALKESLVARGSTKTWETAVQYHLLHSVAMLGLAAIRTNQDSAALRGSTLSWTLGVGLFSGSLYGLALGGPRWLGPITPLGGLLLIAGWVGVGYHALAGPDQPLKEE
eukprot:TRINITY_DN20226_c0_g1_i7.p3 TRINITY_DN20226_c0_g1~~TRINITY_DN20226_c0_g1_i7.p3  ORF type:complete len:129 (-),score=18.13 TRINITY_DN20226_c0_g1_i7:284-670(-)